MRKGGRDRHGIREDELTRHDGLSCEEELWIVGVDGWKAKRPEL